MDGGASSADGARATRGGERSTRAARSVHGERPREGIVMRNKGQGLTEYVLIVGLVAVIAIPAVLRYSTQLRVTVVGTGREFDGKSVVNSPLGVPPGRASLAPGH